jgi:hypothetical protein
VLGRLLATIPTVVEKSCVEETYPSDPRPAVVDAKLLERTAVERYPEVPSPATVLANPVTVERYPKDPRPAVVDAKLFERTAVER